MVGVGGSSRSTLGAYRGGRSRRRHGIRAYNRGLRTLKDSVAYIWGGLVLQKGPRNGPTRAFTRPPHPYTGAELYRRRTTTYHGKTSGQGVCPTCAPPTPSRSRGMTRFSR